MVQDKLIEEKDEFVESLNLTPEKIKEDFESVKSIEGFPKGEDEDILDLSNPPYYTAYPNPYIKDFIEYYGTPYDEETDDYNVEPFVGDVSEGKNDKIYVAHSYHTKVPPKAIEKYIEHYTKPGDIVFDGFCGSGMTGVAARKLGRNVILNDLSSIATFLSSNFNSTPNINKFLIDSENILRILHKDFDEIYTTKHENNGRGTIKYVVWSDLYTCPFCHQNYSLWEFKQGLSSKDIICPNPNCEIHIDKKELTKYKKDGKVVTEPVLINYAIGSKRYTKIPDQEDIELMNKINHSNIPYWYPIDVLPDGYNLSQPKKSHQISNVSEFYMPRSLLVLSKLFSLSNSNILKFIFTSLADRHAVIRNRCLKSGPTRPLSNTLYVPDIKAEVNILEIYKRKRNDIKKAFDTVNYKNHSVISTQASNDLSNIPTNVIDYIFVDPPFGSNIMYSELNFVLESWLKVKTNNEKEAIKNEKHNKTEKEYNDLIEECFKEFYRILKPNRWITIEFHNSKAEIWKIIQNSIIKAGFVIAQVAVLDKKQGTIHQDAKVTGSVKNDLVINAYKPSTDFSTRFLQKAGNNLEFDFIKMHLEKLPVEANIERTQQMLYSKLLAQYIQNGFEINMDAAEFYELLSNNFAERDNFWFTFEQASQYEESIKLKKNLDGIDLGNSILGIDDEKSAIVWLAQFLTEPKSYTEIYENYIKNLLTSQDNIPELKNILDENFVSEDNKYRLPTSIERSHKEERRNKQLQKEFNNLLEKINSSKKKIKEVRKEALLYGLMNLYKEKEVDLIKTIGNRVDRNIINSDDDISTIIDWAMYK